MNRTSQIATLVIILVAVLGLFGFAAFYHPKAAPVAESIPTEKMVMKGDQMTGTTTAKVTVVEWGDFECPFCGQEAPTIAQLIKTYGANPEFNFVFKNYPLPQHVSAKPAAEAALAAGAQGKYWEMYDLLYAKQSAWVEQPNSAATFLTYAKQLGLDETKFAADLKAHTYLAQVNADLATATALKLNHTPFIFINGQPQKNLSYAGLSSAVDTELKR